MWTERNRNRIYVIVPPLRSLLVWLLWMNDFFSASMQFSGWTNCHCRSVWVCWMFCVAMTVFTAILLFMKMQNWQEAQIWFRATILVQIYLHIYLSGVFMCGTQYTLSVLTNVNAFLCDECRRIFTIHSEQRNCSSSVDMFSFSYFTPH